MGRPIGVYASASRGVRRDRAGGPDHGRHRLRPPRERTESSGRARPGTTRGPARCSWSASTRRTALRASTPWTTSRRASRRTRSTRSSSTRAASSTSTTLPPCRGGARRWWHTPTSAYLLMHPADAERLGLVGRRDGTHHLAPGEHRGAPPRQPARWREGELFMPFHFAEAPVNRLTRDELDPLLQDRAVQAIGLQGREVGRAGHQGSPRRPAGC